MSQQFYMMRMSRTTRLPSSAGSAVVIGLVHSSRYRAPERARIMYHYLNGTIYSGIITRQDIKFVMGNFKDRIRQPDCSGSEKPL